MKFSRLISSTSMPERFVEIHRCVDASKSSADDHNSASHIPVPNLTKPKKPSIPKYLPAQAIFRHCLSPFAIASTRRRELGKAEPVQAAR
jgi:hypothetical protein